MSAYIERDDVIKWKHFPRNWQLVWGIHRSPVNSPHKGQWRGTLVFPLICVWINGWENNRETGDLRRCRAHYDVTVMEYRLLTTGNTVRSEQNMHNYADILKYTSYQLCCCSFSNLTPHATMTLALCQVVRCLHKTHRQLVKPSSFLSPKIHIKASMTI